MRHVFQLIMEQQMPLFPKEKSEIEVKVTSIKEKITGTSIGTSHDQLK